MALRIFVSNHDSVSGESCVSSESASNDGIRFVGERPSLTDTNRRLIICNELYPSENGAVMVYRQDLRDERVPNSGMTFQYNLNCKSRNFGIFLPRQVIIPLNQVVSSYVVTTRFFFTAVSADQCEIESSAAKWIVRAEPGRNSPLLKLCSATLLSCNDKPNLVRVFGS